MKTFFILVTLALSAVYATGQSSGVPIHTPDQDSVDYRNLTNAIYQIREAGEAIQIETVREQLRRSSCRLSLPSPNTDKLEAHDVYERARASHFRLGWFYLCNDCNQWQLRLAAGYVLTADGALATSYHVVEGTRDMRQGYLVAANESGKVFPVVEVLAANRYSDACIVRIQGDQLAPLPLNPDARPGDTVYCFSDPLGRRGYFSAGIVNRFFQLPERRLVNAPGAPLFAPMRINVTADWASGSSGAAVLDQCGNAIGQVSTVSPASNGGPDDKSTSETATIVFHEAASARDLLALMKRMK